MTVITDGLENASREWSGEALRQLIDAFDEMDELEAEAEDANS